jgi:SAM-dependent methyltransferase
MWHELVARLVRTSRLVDRAYLIFNRLRSRSVLTLGNDRFFDAYNALTYRKEPLHREGPAPWTLRAWERDFIGNLPAPPARLLVGGAGTGREATALAELGYEVAAFDPARALVEHMRAPGTDPGVEPLVGGYLDLPLLRSLDGATIDLSARPRFDGAYMGWSSFSHLRSDAECVSALTRLADLTRGPVLLSYLAGAGADAEPRPGFSVQIGFFRLLSGGHVRRLAAGAGLDVVSLLPDENWPRAVLVRPAGAVGEFERE